MADPIINVPFTATIEPALEDDAGNPITGATWTDGGSYDPNGDAWDPSASIESVSGNSYRLVEYTFDAPGEWVLIATPNGDPVMNVIVTFRVLAATANPTASAIAAAVVAQPVAGAAAGTLGGKVSTIGSIPVRTQIDAVESFDIVVRPGTAYQGNDAFSWTAEWPVDLNGATVTFRAYANDQLRLTQAATVAGDVIAVSLTATQTTGLALSTAYYEWRYELTAVLDGGSSVQLVAGTMTVER